MELSINTKYLSYTGGGGETIDFSVFGTLANSYLNLANRRISRTKMLKKIEKFRNELIKLSKVRTNKSYYEEKKV